MQNRLEHLLNLYHDEPHDCFTRYAIALEYKSHNEINLAIQWLEQLRTDSPDYVPTYYMLTELYLHQQNQQQAENVCRNGLSAAKEAGDHHAYSELMALLEEMSEG